MKPRRVDCGAATGWGRAIRRKSGFPLLCATCALRQAFERWLQP